MKEKAILDHHEGLVEMDKGRMIEMITSLPQAMNELLGGMGLEVPLAQRPSNIIFSGMGGSAISGDIIRCWLEPTMRIPVRINRGYGIPSFAGPDTLFISVSFSGNTEETLSAFGKAIEQGCKVVAFSSGGVLEERSKDAGVPHHKIVAHQGIVPRAALGHMLVPLAMLLENSGLAKAKDGLVEAVEVLKDLNRSLGPKVPWEDNESKRIATQLHGLIPVIHGHGILEVAALRWKTQLNENAKVLAWADMLPEMDHNTIVGWDGDPTARNHCSVILRDARSEEADPRIRNRIEATNNAAWKKASRVIQVSSEGNDPIARIMSTIYKGDFASVYLSFLRRVDPTPVHAIEDLKKRLKEG